MLWHAWVGALRCVLCTMAGGAHSTVDLVLPVLLLALGNGILADALLRHVLPKWLQVPFTVLMSIFGVGWGVISEATDLRLVGESVTMWQSMHPHAILFLLLPPLIFESAFNLVRGVHEGSVLQCLRTPFHVMLPWACVPLLQDPHVFYKIRAHALFLATVGVTIASCLTAIVLRATFTTYNWDWPTAWLAGSMLSATDPVAVVAVLRCIGAPPGLSSLIEGESLLNDGTAFVMFLVFKDMVDGHEAGAGDVTFSFLYVACADVFGCRRLCLQLQLCSRVFWLAAL